MITEEAGESEEVDLLGGDQAIARQEELKEGETTETDQPEEVEIDPDPTEGK